MRTITIVAIMIPLLFGAVESAAASAHDQAARILAHSASFRARVQAAFALGTFDDSGSQPKRQKALVRALADRHPAVRAAAATSLGKVGDTRSLRALRRMRRDGHRAVRSKSSDAVIKIETRIASANPRSQSRELKHTLPNRGPELGDVDAKIARDPKAVATMLRAILQEELRARGDLRRANTIRIDARVVRLDFRRQRRGLQLHSELSLILVDRTNHNLIGAATSRVKISGGRGRADRPAMLRESLREASKAALRDLSGIKLALR